MYLEQVFWGFFVIPNAWQVGTQQQISYVFPISIIWVDEISKQCSLAVTHPHTHTTELWPK